MTGGLRRQAKTAMAEALTTGAERTKKINQPSVFSAPFTRSALPTEGTERD